MKVLNPLFSTTKFYPLDDCKHNYLIHRKKGFMPSTLRSIQGLLWLPCAISQTTTTGIMPLKTYIHPPSYVGLGIKGILFISLICGLNFSFASCLFLFLPKKLPYLPLFTFLISGLISPGYFFKDDFFFQEWVHGLHS
jgi:hypothetical protein